MLSDDARLDAAQALWDAEFTQTPIAPLRETWPDLDVVDAYEIQLINIRKRMAQGATIHGHKVGLSSKAMQELQSLNDKPDTATNAQILFLVLNTEDEDLGGTLAPEQLAHIARHKPYLRKQFRQG